MKSFAEVINESKSFKIGNHFTITDFDGVEVKLGLEILRELIGKYIDMSSVYPRKNYVEKGHVIIKVKNVLKPPHCNYTFVGDDDKYYEPTYNKIINITSIKDFEEREKKKLSHLEIDPYGEEEWE